MKNYTKTYTKVRGFITNSIILLEILKENLAETHELASEIEYWHSSFVLLRNCLYGVSSKYEGQLDILESIKELRQEITNSLKIIRNFDTRSLKYLDNIWNNCRKIEDLLS